MIVEMGGGGEWCVHGLLNNPARGSSGAEKEQKKGSILGRNIKSRFFFRSAISVHFLRQMFSTLDILLVFRQTPFVLKVVTYTIVFFSKTALSCDYVSAGPIFHRRYSSPSVFRGAVVN